MNAVDVLAVMLADYLDASIERQWDDDAPQLADASEEARAAVARLIEANRTLIQRHDEDAKLANFDRCGCSVCVELRPALARCIGEGA